jgi:hypothetical protein
MADNMVWQFMGEANHPVVGTIEADGRSSGAPGLPRKFWRRSRTFQIARVLKTWRETGPCYHGSDESYVRKHWIEVLTGFGETMKIYFERQPRSRSGKGRWWLFTIGKPSENRA